MIKEFILVYKTPLPLTGNMVQSRTRHPLFTNQLGLLVTAERRGESYEQPGGSHSYPQ